MKPCNIELILDALQKCAIHFEKTSPVVSNWADEIYQQIQEDLYRVDLGDMRTLNLLLDDAGNFIHPNYAQNIVYKHLEMQRKDTTGMMSF